MQQEYGNLYVPPKRPEFRIRSRSLLGNPLVWRISDNVFVHPSPSSHFRSCEKQPCGTVPESAVQRFWAFERAEQFHA